MQKSRLLSKNKVKLENFSRNLNQTNNLWLLQRSYSTDFGYLIVG